MTLPLFGEVPEETLPLAGKLRAKLGDLARDGVFIGGSSWKYEGWLEQIYRREKYLARGRYSKRKFEEDCLSEYAAIFPIVCGDFSFYQFPSAAYWQRLFASTPETFRFAFKVPEEITVRTWPRHERYGPRAGMANENFLNAEVFRIAFADALRPYAARVAVLIFEFGAFARLDIREFLDSLDRFLGQLPDGFRFAVEVRNPEILGPEYFALLARHRVAHVLNAWTRMPELSAQIVLPHAFTTDFYVVRALLRQGRPYERAVEMFSPYETVQDPNPEGREAIRQVIRRSQRERQPSYIFVNNRFEGNAPKTMEAIVDEL
jgi:uncharacterized protein YecE (DUF72 family)